MKVKIVFLIFILIFLAGCSSSAPGKYDAFADCLATAGAVMYGSEWCGHCKNQKEMFGSSFKYIAYVDCDRSEQLCFNAGVMGFPTWVINGENYPGERNFYELSQLSGCKLT